MANVSLKADFKDGDKLFAQQLNNNFNAIMAALAAMNRIVWQDDPDDTVVTFRGTTEEINSRDIIDGQLLYDTSTGETYIDYGSQRISTGSGNAIFIGEDEPTNEATQLWIDPTDMLNVIGSEIESGNNSNGNWVKYADGTMVQWSAIDKTQFLQASSYSTTVQGIAWYRSKNPSVSFPNNFINANYSIQITPYTGLNGSRLIIPRIAGKTVSGFELQLISVEDFISSGVGYTNLNAVEYIAIGRWK